MADYQLTQTGDEVQDILDNSQTGKYFYNQTVATWSSDATYADYPKKGLITLTGVKGTDGVEVTFSNADATSGNYAPICNTVANGVEIWAKTQDNALVIPTIHITTGADVQLSGDDAYLPISGGNITGSLSVLGNNVLTTAHDNVTVYPLTASSDITDGYSYCAKVGRIVIVGLNMQVTTAIANANKVMMSGLPNSTAKVFFDIASDGSARRCYISEDGYVKSDSSSIPTGWYDGSVAYISAT